MKFVFDKRPDMTINFSDHMVRENQRTGESVAMEVMGHGFESDSFTLRFVTRDQARAPHVTSEPTGKRVDVWVTLDKKMASLLASWIIQRTNNDSLNRQQLEFEEDHGRKIVTLPLKIEV